ncbi:cytochrome c-type biogenesis protein CcsB [Muriicola jejuensis]|uniref:Cytochrome C biogenesis protein n=1 Tax=Muriicola jejuensis TaxID=504488 RepID=A0A6P0UEN7_9FLAO|nr:cytochrome c biogenesis protein CcsA [Muriicola jejuensis]NER11467.1 cytochrome C biogenesis protein [Muriicola jejuensis]SMP20616.1 cytochrome c-type biogenesis protein CcsB [Muriicola jejuensis]
MIKTLKKILFSTRLMAVLFLLFAAAMAIGTFMESMYSTETAKIYIYNAKWFEIIMIFFVINFIGNMFRYRLLQWNKWPVLLLHISWILIIVGAGVTRYIGYEGMMPIREGNTENIFYSDKTYLTVLVDGEMEGELKRKPLQDDLIVTPEGIQSSLPWRDDFNGQDFEISFAGFIKGAKRSLVPDENGTNFLKIVESGDGNRHEHFLSEGEVANVHNVLFALNKETEGAINIYWDGTSYQIKSPFEGSFMRMADQFQGDLLKDSLQTLQLRSLYSLGNMQFVFPEPVIKGSYGVVQVPEEEQTPNTQDALILDITTGGETVRKEVLGGKGSSSYMDKFTLGGLDFTLGYGSKIYELPFSIKLNDFIAEKYPGTEKAYASFMSKITVEDERPFDYDIYMNHVLDHKGYRFFQASFDPDEKGTVLSVNHDRPGTWITYTGYFMLYLGLLGIMFFGKTRFKDLANSLEKLKKKKATLTAVLLIGMLLPMNAQVAPQTADHVHTSGPSETDLDSMLRASTIPDEHAARFGKLIVQDEGGRMKPINTFASELLRKLSLKDAYKDLNADQVFLSMMLNPALWYNTDFIALDKKAQNDSIRKIIGVPQGQRYIKATDFFDAQGRNKLGPYLQEAFATNTPNKFQQDFKDAYFRLSLLDRTLSGEILKIFPLLDDENNKWISATEFRSGRFQVSDSLYANFIRNVVPYYLMSLREAKVTGDYTEADKILKAFSQNQKNHGSEVLPSENRIEAETIYNKLDIFNRLYKYYALVGILMFLVLVLRIFKEREIWKIATYFFKGVIYLFFIWHTAGLIMRWYISGHAPWSDAYESILYVSWATLAMGISLGRKSDMTIAASTFVTSMLLWIAHQSWVDPSIANLVPVLDSYWLMIHVAVIVGSYGPLTVGMILGVVSLLLIILTNKSNKAKMDLNLKELTIINELALTVGVIMLTIGNFLGGQWANESWGRYWGWDPKETWALISIFIYAFVIHTRLVPGLRGRWTFNFLSIIAFSSIMMTYFGVNFYLVGLHSYASGAQVITPSFIWYTVIGVMLLGAVSYWRYRVNYTD